jgi:hypothetical protein
MPNLPQPLSSYVDYSRTAISVGAANPISTTVTATASLGNAFTLVDTEALLPHRGEFALELEIGSGLTASNTGPAVSLKYAWTTQSAATYGALSAGSSSLDSTLRTVASATRLVVSDSFLAKARYLGMWIDSAALSSGAVGTVTGRIIAV